MKRSAEQFPCNLLTSWKTKVEQERWREHQAWEAKGDNGIQEPAKHNINSYKEDKSL